MASSLPEIQRLLLELLSPERWGPAVLGEPLTDDDLANLLKIARSHRLGPLLGWQLRELCPRSALARQVRESLASEDRAHLARTLKLQSELADLTRLLSAHGIPSVSLKGAFLAWHAYPRPYLRPMQDLDVLVPRPEALRAYQLLLSAGYTRMPSYPGSPEGAVEWMRHLPPLLSPTRFAQIEVHVRLTEPRDRDRPRFDPCDAGGYWDRAIRREVSDVLVAYESPADLLLHLVLHAVSDHSFDNGPLLLSDVAFLLQKHPVDWPLFWNLASLTGHTRSCALVLALTECHRGRLPIEWPAEGLDLPDTRTLDAAAHLLVRLRRYEGDSRISRAMTGSLLDRIAYLGRLAFPSKEKLSAAFPVRSDDPAVYFRYLSWWKVLAGRVPGYLQSRQDADLRREVEQIAVVESWLDSSPMNPILGASR